MLLKIFNASTEFMFWLSISHLTAFDCVDLAESGGYGVVFRRQSVGCKRRYGKYCLFYTVQECKLVTAKFCYRAN